MKPPTWAFELLVAAHALALPLCFSFSWLELVGAGAVLLALAHAQVADRMAEQEAKRTEPDVHCWRWSRRYFVGKELLWLAYFVGNGSWTALVGCGVFLLYPLWRSWYRRRWPVPQDCGCRPLPKVARRFTQPAPPPTDPPA